MPLLYFRLTPRPSNPPRRPKLAPPRFVMGLRSASTIVSSWAPPTHRRINQRGDQDENALKYILVGFRQTEKGGGVENFRQQQRAEHCADERSTSAAQARSAKHDSGDARQRIVRALPGIADADLAEQHHGAKRRQQRRSDIAGDERAIDANADPPRRFLIGAYRSKPPARPGVPQRVFAGNCESDQDQERQGHRPILLVDDVSDSGVDVSARDITQQEAHPLKADIHRQGRGNRSEIRKSYEKSVDRADDECAGEHQEEARGNQRWRLAI